MNVNEFSNKVADYLEICGHNQDGHYYNGETACVLGALWRVAVAMDGDDAACIETMSECRAILEDRVSPTITHWSDNTSTEEVIATLRGLGK